MPRPKKTKAEVSESRRRAALARHAAMTPEQRSEAARMAGEARWSGVGQEERTVALEKARKRAAKPAARRKAEATKETNMRFIKLSRAYNYCLDQLIQHPVGSMERKSWSDACGTINAVCNPDPLNDH